MRVVIATPLYPPQIGGPAKYAQELQREFAKEGHAVEVVRFNLAFPPGVRHLAYFVRVFGALGRADAALVLDTWSVGLPAVFAARLRGKKAIVRIGGDFLWEAWTTRTGQAVKLSDFYTSPHALSLKERIIRAGTGYLLRHSIPAFTTAWQRDLWQQFYSCPHAKVVGNFYPPAGDPVPPGARIFLATGRDIALKNKRRLLEAFARIKERHQDAQLDDTPAASDEYREKMRACYAVVVPSLSEVNSNTAIEAAALRKPFIAPLDCGGKAELEGMGLFVDTTKTEELEAAMERLLDAAVYQACVEASAHLVPHSWSHIAREYAALMN